MSLFADLHQHFVGLEAELNRLDAATGDGDHGTTMVKGLAAAAEAEAGTAAKAFRGAAGGASGSLFGVVVGAVDGWVVENGDLGAALDNAATKVTRLGQAVAGDKTMLDALIPAGAAAGGGDGAARRAANAAAAGAEATVGMRAKRGRARYVEDGGVGHGDAGARSVAEMLGVLAAYVEARQ